MLKVSPAQRRRLDGLLAAWGPDGATPAGLGFAQLDTVHFASVTLFDRPFLDTLLVIECNFDGDLDAFLPAFAQHAGGLPALLNCCLGPAADSPRAVVEILRAAAVKPAAWHVGATGLSRREILASEALVSEVRDHLCGHQLDLAGRDAPVVASALRHAFGDRCPPIAARRTLGEIIAAATPAAIAVLVVLALLGLSILWRSPWPMLFPAVLVALGVATFLWAERREPVRERPQATDARAGRNENRPGTVQNHFSSLAPLKTGPVRWASLRVFMWLLNQLARLVFTKGELGRIPSIHFAHWSVLDEGSTLLFVSNYGGTWESYLDDFIQKAADGLTGVWSHCQGFPASRWLIKGGARDEQAFKQYARDTQAAEAIWFSAYPQLTTRRINNNRAIVEGLAGVSDEAPERWLARI